MCGNNKSFKYTSSKACTIKADSSLKFDEGFIFKYEPASLEKDLLVFEDATARMELNRAQFTVPATGIILTKGTICIKGNSRFTAGVGQYVNEGITLGNGTTAGDCMVIIKSGSTLTQDQGALNYKNTASSSWVMESNNAQLQMDTTTTLRLYETLNLGKGKIIFSGNNTLAYVAGKDLIGPVIPQGTLSTVIISSN